MSEKKEIVSDIKSEKEKVVADIRGKKNKVIYDIKDRIAIEEFLFVTEQSTEIISSKVKGERQSNINESELRKLTDHYYLRNKSTIYTDTDTILNGLIKFNKEKQGKQGKVLPKLFIENEPRNVEVSLFCEIDDNLFYKKQYDTKKYSLEGTGYIEVKNNIPLLQHFQNREVIEGLYVLAKKNIEKLPNKEEFIVRTQNIAKNLNSLMVEIVNPKKTITLEIKLWRELILEKAEDLLSCLMGEKKTGISIRVRTFILKSFIEAVGIEAKIDVNRQDFLAEILGTTREGVRASFREFKKVKMGLKKDGEFENQLKEAVKICELLMNEENPEGVLIIKRMIDKISNTVPTE